MTYGYNEDKSRTVVCHLCGSMVHADYTDEHNLFHDSLIANFKDLKVSIKDSALATLKVCRDEMRGGLDRLSEDLRQMSKALDQWARNPPSTTLSDPNDLEHTDKKK